MCVTSRSFPVPLEHGITLGQWLADCLSVCLLCLFHTHTSLPGPACPQFRPHIVCNGSNRTFYTCFVFFRYILVWTGIRTVGNCAGTDFWCGLCFLTHDPAFGRTAADARERLPCVVLKRSLNATATTKVTHAYHGKSRAARCSAWHQHLDSLHSIWHVCVLCVEPPTVEG